MGEHGGLGAWFAPADGAQIDEFAEFARKQGQRVLGGADVDGEHRPIGEHAEEGPRPAGHAQGARGLAGYVHRLWPAPVYAGD